MEYSKYEKYKDSGTAWLGEIPEHWEVQRGKDIGKFDGSTVDKKINGDEDIVRIVNFTDVFNNQSLEIHEQNFMKVSAKPNQIKNFNLIIGDVLLTPSSEDRFDIGRSNVVKYTDDDLLYSYHLIRLRFTKDIDINFKKYIFNNKFIFGYFSSVCTGTTRQILVRDKLKNIPIFLPPKQEQTTIANFLDYKTEKINRFIKKKKQLIKLLNEQKAAIINQAVTKGLDQNAKMKDSGIEWLGEIPEHWEVRKLKYSVRLNMHTEFDNKESIKNKIALENIEGKTGRILSLNENSFEGVGTIFKNGDVLFGKLRPYLAKVVSPNFEGNCVNELLVLTPNKKDWNPEYLKYRMLASDFISIVDNSTYGAKMPRASWNFIGTLKISKPIKTEQSEIVRFIEKETELVSKTISTIEKEITLVEEYKTALIAEAVTGKIDVRDFKIPQEEASLAMVAEEAVNYKNTKYG